MELTYHWEGDVLIPDLELEDGSNYQIGKYGRMAAGRKNEPEIKAYDRKTTRKLYPNALFFCFKIQL